MAVLVKSIGQANSGGDAWAAVGAAQLSRHELRGEIGAVMANTLAPCDVAVMVAIGLLGALPTSGSAVDVPPDLQGIFKGGVAARDALVANLSGDAAGASIRSAIDFAGQQQGLEWLAFAAGGAVDAGLLPDLEDGFETLATAKLTDWWCTRRGWRDGDAAYHHAKAIAYGVNAVVGAYFNPDPLAFGLAVWHVYCALRASGALTDRLRELVDRAIAEGRATIEAYDREVALTERSAVTPPRALAFGEIDDADNLYATAPRRVS